MVSGQIANTNARTISESLAGIGVAVVWHSAVGDDVERIAAVVRAALARADVLIVCGGLGPTHDDVTREALAAATGRSLQRSPELEAELGERFLRMGRAMVPANLRQADLLAGAVTIPNPVGTAPGVFLDDGTRAVYLLPGVPAELGAMMEGFVLPSLAGRLRRLGSAGQALVTTTVRTAGVAEAELAEVVAPVIARASEGGVPVAILASQGEVRVCLTAPATGPAAAVARSLEAEIRSLLGRSVYGAGGDTLEAVVSSGLRALGLRLAVAESLTGGMLASRLVSVPGASDILAAGYVAYSAAAKVRDLGVPEDTIERYGLVSVETAIAMAEGARLRTGADVAISTTGEAGPAPAESEVGRVCVGLSWAARAAGARPPTLPGAAMGLVAVGRDPGFGRQADPGDVLAWEAGHDAWCFASGGTRDLIRRRSCTLALNQLRLWLLERGAP